MNRTKGHGGILRFVGCSMVLLLFLCSAASASGLKVELAADDWTWEANGVSSFHGTVRSEEDLPEVRMTLSVGNRLEDPGAVQFISLNGKTLKLRKRAPEADAALKAGEDFVFEGEWYVPENTDGGISQASILLRVLSEDGTELGSGLLEMGSQEDETARINADPERRADMLVWTLAAASALVWAFALIRHAVLNSRNRKERNI